MQAKLDYIRPDAEQAIEHYARVSNPNPEYPKRTGDLIKYLIKHRHWSPFEMVHATMLIECTRDIGRQILRHRSFAFQEFSQRYAMPTLLGEFPTKEARLQDKTNRQNSIESGGEHDDWWHAVQQDAICHALVIYEQAIERGIAKECARVVFPEGLTPSKLFMTGSIRSWIHYVQVRKHKSAQKEHRLLALTCADQFRHVLPNIMWEM